MLRPSHSLATAVVRWCLGLSIALLVLTLAPSPSTAQTGGNDLRGLARDATALAKACEKDLKAARTKATRELKTLLKAAKKGGLSQDELLERMTKALAEYHRAAMDCSRQLQGELEDAGAAFLAASGEKVVPNGLRRGSGGPLHAAARHLATAVVREDAKVETVAGKLRSTMCKQGFPVHDVSCGTPKWPEPYVGPFEGMREGDPDAVFIRATQGCKGTVVVQGCLQTDDLLGAERRGTYLRATGRARDGTFFEVDLEANASVTSAQGCFELTLVDVPPGELTVSYYLFSGEGSVIDGDIQLDSIHVSVPDWEEPTEVTCQAAESPFDGTGKVSVDGQVALTYPDCRVTYDVTEGGDLVGFEIECRDFTRPGAGSVSCSASASQLDFGATTDLSGAAPGSAECTGTIGDVLAGSGTVRSVEISSNAICGASEGTFFANSTLTLRCDVTPDGGGAPVECVLECEFDAYSLQRAAPVVAPSECDAEAVCDYADGSGDALLRVDDDVVNAALALRNGRVLAIALEVQNVGGPQVEHCVLQIGDDVDGVSNGTFAVGDVASFVLDVIGDPQGEPSIATQAQPGVTVAISGIPDLNDLIPGQPNDVDIRVDVSGLFRQATANAPLSCARSTYGSAAFVSSSCPEHAPEESRVTILENVPLHREIVAAWKEHVGETPDRSSSDPSGRGVTC